MPCLEKYQCCTRIVSESKPQMPLSLSSTRDCYRKKKKKRVNIHRLWEISLEWKKIRAMDFCFSEVIYPFENPTKARDPFPPLCPFSICKMHIHVTFSHPWGSLKRHSLRLKIPVSGSDWKLNKNKLIRGGKEAQVR